MEKRKIEYNKDNIMLREILMPGGLVKRVMNLKGIEEKEPQIKLRTFIAASSVALQLGLYFVAGYGL